MHLGQCNSFGLDALDLQEAVDLKAVDGGIAENPKMQQHLRRAALKNPPNLWHALVSPLCHVGILAICDQSKGAGMASLVM